MGPVLLSRLLGLTKVQEGVLSIVFRIAADRQMLLIDMKDLRSMLNYVSEHAKEYTTTYGNVSSQSVGAILRALIAVESDEAKSAVIQGQASLMAKYSDAIDRESAFEMIQDEREQNAVAEELARERAELEAQKAEFAKQQEEAKKTAEKEAERQQKAAEREAERQAKAAERERQKQKDAVARVATSILGFAGRTAANQNVRGLFGTRRSLLAARARPWRAWPLSKLAPVEVGRGTWDASKECLERILECIGWLDQLTLEEDSTN